MAPPQGQGLNDLYVRFYRVAERRIAEMSGHGVVCFISNYSWLDGLSFTGMRENYLEKFDEISIDCLNGDSRKTGKLTPDSKPDPSVFSTQWNREGIQVGTAIGLLVRNHGSRGTQTIKFEHFWGQQKREDLVRSLAKSHYSLLTPSLQDGLSFLPAKVGDEYHAWPTLTRVIPISFPGVKTSRDKLVVDIDKEELLARMKSFFDPELSYQEWNVANPDLLEKTNRFDPKSVREYLVRRGFIPNNVVNYQYRPFDKRWLYWEPETKLLDEKRSEYFPHVDPTNIWIEARQKQPMEHFDRGYATRLLADNLGNGLSSYFPLTLKTSELHGPLLHHPSKSQRTANLSDEAIRYVGALDSDESLPFFHVVSILNAPAYRFENGGALRQDWPHIPLPKTEQELRPSAALGKEIASLLDTESPVKHVTSGDIRPELKPLAVPTRASGGNLKDSELVLTAGWGHAGKGGITMPGKGKLVERDYSLAERKSILEGAKALGLSEKQAFDHLGASTCDVYLNGIAYWSNIPQKVWDYTIGGYQVIKKWLSYREEPLLGRPLAKDEVRYVQEMARRIAAILLLEPALDANYEAIKKNTFPWPPKS